MADPNRFVTTRWSLVLAAQNSRDPDSDEALARLCEIYWPPVYAFICSRRHDAENARDLTQGFFTVVLEKGYFKDARRERGRLRTFLLTSVKHFLANEWDKQQALKRGPGKALLRLDFDSVENRYKLEPADYETPDKAFERRWAMTTLERVLERLRVEMRRSGKEERFRSFSAYLTADGDGVTYNTLAAELGMTESSVKVAIHRLRKRYGELLREEVLQTVGSPEAVDDEIRYLFEAMGN
jgi:RNA polymerase sigma-70 factor (ECF subfamily)